MQRPPSSSRPIEPRLLAGLGAAAAAVGLLAAAALGLALSGGEAAGWIASIAAAWRRLFGWGAWASALGLAWAGAGLVAHRHTDPWRLPWSRALGAEIALAAALALAALGSDSGVEPGLAQAGGEAGRGGLVGWALALATAQAVGHPLAALAWLCAGTLGVLAAFGVGARGIATALDRLADAITDRPVTPARRAASATGRGGPTATPRQPAAQGSRQPPGRAGGQPAGQGSREPLGRAGGQPAAQGSRQPAGPAAGQPAGQPGGPGSRQTGGRTSRPPEGRPGGPAPDGGGAAVSGASTGGGRAVRGKAPAAAAGRVAGKAARRLRPGGLPELDCLDDVQTAAGPDTVALGAMADTIARTLAGFDVPVEVVSIEPGPTVTRFGLKPGLRSRAGRTERVRVARIAALRQDLALALAAPALRIEAPIPGRALVGIEVPNPAATSVGLRGVIDSPAWSRAGRNSTLVIALGRDVTGETVVADLGSMPHLLIAGTTGSGKSVGLNAILCSLLFQNTPDHLRLVLVDPKRVELAAYQGLPHLLAPVVTDPPEAVAALRWVVAEMEARYARLAASHARDRAGYNRRIPAGEPPMPALVVVIDELADLMLAAPAETEPYLTRIAQLGRAGGIHLVVATQRPSVDVLTGLIKANFPARIAFAVASGADSRVILDQVGAETLLGRGDMLFQPPDAAQPRRLQGARVTDAEVARVVDFWRRSHWAAPVRVPPWEDLLPSDDPDADVYARAADLARTTGDVSPSLLQRRLRIGYGRARAIYARLLDEGLVGDEHPGGAAGGAHRPPPGGLDWVDDEFQG